MDDEASVAKPYPTKGDLFPETPEVNRPDYVFGAVLFTNGTFGSWNFNISDQASVTASVDELFETMPHTKKAWLGAVVVENPDPQPMPEFPFPFPTPTPTPEESN
jgi:hypothetical protein